MNYFHVIIISLDETDDEHLDTVRINFEHIWLIIKRILFNYYYKKISLLQLVKFEHAFMFAYSLRDKTNAAYTMNDNIPNEIKLQRLQHVK